jgi:putative endonuclease
MKKRRGIGAVGEEIACRFLKRHAFLVVARNFYTRFGEIDIVAFDTAMRQLVFVEVKTRTAQNAVPEQAITRQKLRKMKRAAILFMQKIGRYTDQYRFDSIAVLYRRGQTTAHIRHHRAILAENCS